MTECHLPVLCSNCGGMRCTNCGLPMQGDPGTKECWCQYEVQIVSNGPLIREATNYGYVISYDSAWGLPCSITCAQCGMTSYHPKDVEHRYCGKCHRFHDIFIELSPVIGRAVLGRSTVLTIDGKLVELLSDLLKLPDDEDC